MGKESYEHSCKNVLIPNNISGKAIWNVLTVMVSRANWLKVISNKISNLSYCSLVPNLEENAIW